MTKSDLTRLTRREREIMNILFRRERATATEIQEELRDAPSNSAVRTLLKLLEERGHVKHVQEGARFVYVPAMSRATARRAALSDVVKTFFGGSVEDAVATLVESSSTCSATRRASSRNVRTWRSSIETPPSPRGSNSRSRAATLWTMSVYCF